MSRFSLNFSVHFLNRNTFNTVFLMFSVKCSQLSVTRTFLNFCWSFVLLEVDILFSVSLGKENNCIEWKLPLACVHKNLLALCRAVITWFWIPKGPNINLKYLSTFHLQVVEWLLNVVNHLPSEDQCQKCLVAPVDDKEKHDDMMLGRTKCYDLVTKVSCKESAVTPLEFTLIKCQK